eukprot:TRINITY_DN31424_c0_g1_i1.p1 TRINITY_DN31424_c0_g1~~TRINITY_DN31424_c0_g1_i1.p1  ORF type:complete len:204 (-),score=42.20 TRINITY_DN31424_c0_g1_i1:120-731(-)
MLDFSDIKLKPQNATEFKTSTTKLRAFRESYDKQLRDIELKISITKDSQKKNELVLEGERIRVARQHAMLTERKIKIAYHAAIAKNRNDERDELFSGKKDDVEENSVEIAARNIESLQRTQSLMSNELERIRNVSQVLDEDSNIIGNTSNEHTRMSTTVALAGSLTRKLKRRELTDRVIMWFGIILFLLVVFYVLKRRIDHFL